MSQDIAFGSKDIPLLGIQVFKRASTAVADSGGGGGKGGAKAPPFGGE